MFDRGCWDHRSGPSDGAEIPSDLLEDPHFREEFGVNEVTTPSIRKIFEQLDAMGKISWSRYARAIPAEQPAERSRLALSLGELIAEGFFITETENTERLQDLGNAILRRASALGTGGALGSHVKALMDASQRGDWKVLREELAKAQQQVEVELIRLRDVEAVHLISLGGWLRALEVVCAAGSDSYAPEKVGVIRRLDVVSYYSGELQTLHPRTQQLDYIIGLRQGLEALRRLLEIESEKPISEARLREIRAVVAQMTKWAFGGECSANSIPSPEGVAATRKNGRFGLLREVFPADADAWAKAFAVDADDCVAFKMERGALRAELVLINRRNFPCRDVFRQCKAGIEHRRLHLRADLEQCHQCVDGGLLVQDFPPERFHSHRGHGDPRQQPDDERQQSCLRHLPQRHHRKPRIHGPGHRRNRSGHETD